MSDKVDLQAIGKYYDQKVSEHGTTPRGVDWNSVEGQELRFQQLTSMLPSDSGSVLDFGCGYGAYAKHLKEHRPHLNYIGVDISEEMLKHARQQYPQQSWLASIPTDARYDYAVSSGTFNVKLEHSEEAWWNYIVGILDTLWAHVDRGMAFNFLTSHFDPGFDKPHLFYANPSKVLDFCIQRYSKKVEILHHYPLYEFTVHLYKERS